MLTWSADFLFLLEIPINRLSDLSSLTQPVDLDNLSDKDRRLLIEFESLWAEAADIWTEQSEDASFHAYVSADYRDVFGRLLNLRGTVPNFLEWGSGLGVVTIMASRMGFAAYGIEAEPELVDHAEALSQRFQSNAQFAVGSFIPDEFDWNPAAGDDSLATSIDLADAYGEFDLELRDFGLVYGYPWPTEHGLFQNVMKQFGAPGSLLLTYDAREGSQLARVE